jgi:hypothetical protein
VSSYLAAPAYPEEIRDFSLYKIKIFHPLRVILSTKSLYVRVFLFTFILLVYVIYIRLGVFHDWEGHIGIAERVASSGVLPGPPVFYAIILLFREIFEENTEIKLALSVVFATAFLVKFLIIEKWIRFGTSEKGLVHNEGASAWLALAISLGAGLSSAVLGLRTFFHVGELRLYAGSISLTIWHNGTVILSLPFSMFVAYLSFRHFNDPKRNYLLKISFCCVVIALIKPSFLFIFFPFFSIFSLIYLDCRRNIFEAWASCLPAALVVLLSYL